MHHLGFAGVLFMLWAMLWVKGNKVSEAGVCPKTGIQLRRFASFSAALAVFRAPSKHAHNMGCVAKSGQSTFAKKSATTRSFKRRLHQLWSDVFRETRI